MFVFNTKLPWPCGSLVSRVIVDPNSCNSPGRSRRNGRWKGQVVNVLITDLDENKGLMSGD